MWVKGTSVDKFLYFCFEKKKRRQKWFLALVGFTQVKGTSVRKKDRTTCKNLDILPDHFGSNLRLQIENMASKKASNKRYRKSIVK